MPKHSPADMIFAANLPFSLDDQKLGELFDPFGIVMSSRVARDPATGESRGFGFVEIATDKARTKAIAALNGATVEGRKIEVRLADKPVKAVKPARKPQRLTLSSAEMFPAQETPARRAVLVEYRRLSERRLRSA